MPARVTEAEMRRILAQPQVPKKRQRRVQALVAGYPCTQSVFLILPYPPLNNHYFRHVGHRVLLSEDARKYRKVVAEFVQQTWQQDVQRPFNNRLWCEVTVHAPDKRRFDLDNVWKGLLDSLQHAGVFLNDEQIDDLHIKRGLPQKGGSGNVTVHIKGLSRQRPHG